MRDDDEGEQPWPVRAYDDHEPELDRLAVIAVVTSLVLAPLGLLLGIRSLRRIRLEPWLYRGVSVAWTAIVVGAVLTVVVVGAAVSPLLGAASLWPHEPGVR